MMQFKRYITSLSFILLAVNVPAQDITGTWEGDLGGDQFLQLNIIQTGNKICGYTRDHVLLDQRSFCKAFFEGYFDKQRKKLYITGKYFIQNSGSHVLMKLDLNYKIVDGVEVLEERPTPSRLLLSLLSPFRGLDPDEPADEPQLNTQFVYIKKVSNKPNEMNALMKDCIARDKIRTDTAAKKNIPPRPKDSTPVIVKMLPPKPKDNVKEKLPPPGKKDSVIVVPPPVVNKKESVPVLPKTITERKNKEQSRITVNTKSINLKVYDNAIMDGDTVSILYNGKLLLSHQLLSEKGIDINVQLEDNQTRHEIVLFAENLGSIPPNTALIVITAGEKRYELFASASLEENAVLVFEYRPK